MSNIVVFRPTFDVMSRGVCGPIVVQRSSDADAISALSIISFSAISVLVQAAKPMVAMLMMSAVFEKPVIG